MEELETPPSSADLEPAETEPRAALYMDELLVSEGAPTPVPVEDAQLKAVLEAIVYVAEEPLTAAQMAGALAQPVERIQALLSQLVAEVDQPEHGARSHGHPGSAGRQRSEDAAGPQADRVGGAQERHRKTDPLRDHQGVSDPVRAQGLERAALAQGIRRDQAHGI